MRNDTGILKGSRILVLLQLYYLLHAKKPGCACFCGWQSLTEERTGLLEIVVLSCQLYFSSDCLQARSGLGCQKVRYAVCEPFLGPLCEHNLHCMHGRCETFSCENTKYIDKRLTCKEIAVCELSTSFVFTQT